jgi:hypothetical protein
LARTSILRVASALIAGLCWPVAGAQAPAPQGPETQSTAAAAPDPPPEVPADEITWDNRFWLSGQANFITQYHPSFHADYSGPNSLPTAAQDASSRVLTLFLGVRVAKDTDFLFDVEESGGHGIGEALGLAGFTNLDVVRNPTLSKAPYVARVMLHQTIALSKEYSAAVLGPLGLASSVPVRRLEFRLGKMSTVDFFDLNSIGSDSHYQFLNWVADNNGAYDYAADTRGYSYGFVGEYYDKGWALRFGEMLMPTVANGIKLDWDLARARAENYEFELHPALLHDRGSVVRTLAFVNHADMGNYRQAIEDYLAGLTALPEVISTRRQGRIKYGFGFNAEQELSADLRAYARFGWNEGQNESFAYTEVDQAISFGGDLRGSKWRRKQDKIGVALLVDAISGDHRQYLALGGEGFLLGDGALNYGREKILESYYNLHAWRGVSVGADVQRIWDPGYNRDRGPVWVGSLRLHIEGLLDYWQHEGH